MCFSAEASFTAGVVLVACSSVTLRMAWQRDRRYLPLAAYPLFFGVQQLSEGVLWLSMDTSPALPPALFFLFFAYFFWPFWVPLSATLVEPKQQRRRLFGWITLLGAALGLGLYLPILFDPGVLEIRLERQSIYYLNPHMFPDEISKAIARLVYAAIICGPLLASSHRQVRWFGLLVLASVIVGLLFASYAFTSIWCFLAALISAYMLVVLRAVPAPRAGSAG